MLVFSNVKQTTSHKPWHLDDKAVKLNADGWWYKSGYHSNSTEITVDLPNKNYCFEPAKSYHLWYAEDDHDLSEGDNQGTAKTDVYVKLACPTGHQSLDGKEGCIGTLAARTQYPGFVTTNVTGRGEGKG